MPGNCGSATAVLCHFHVAGGRARCWHPRWVPTHVTHLKGDCPNYPTCQLFLVKRKGAFSALPFSALPLVQPRIQDSLSQKREGKMMHPSAQLLFWPRCSQHPLSRGAYLPGGWRRNHDLHTSVSSHQAWEQVPVVQGHGDAPSLAPTNTSRKQPCTALGQFQMKVINSLVWRNSCETKGTWVLGLNM